MRAIFEPVLDGDSIILWEAGIGHRIVYPSQSMSERSFNWLVEKATAFHKAKEETGVAGVDCYGEPATPYEFTRRFLRVCRKAGYTVYEGSLSRPPEDFW